MGAVFRVLTAKQDTDTQIFNRPIIIGVKDVASLAGSISSQLENYRDISYVDSAKVDFSNNRSREFSEISGLETFDWERPETTSVLTLRWNLLLDIPTNSKPSEHYILIRVACGLKPQDMLRAAFSKQLDELDTLDFAAGGCTCHVTFSSQALASDVFRVVNDWSKSRPSPAYLVPYLRQIRDRSTFISKLIARSIPTSAVFALLAFYWMYTGDLDQTSPATINFIRLTMTFGVCLWFLSIISGILGRKLASRSEGLLHRIGSFHPFSLTAGDNTRQLEIAARNSRSFIRFCVEGAITVAWNLIAGGLIWYFTIQ